ncbi:hypothetical protein MMC25_002552 [Agyrium rufum]|nr:hypothetical protein [Agyrium rufum]
MSTNDAERQYAGPILYLYEQIFHIIDFASFCPTASALQLLQGFLIMNTISASQKPPFVAYGFVAPAIRFAQVLRLHVDPKIDNVVEAEVRRRLWWHLIYLDAESTIASGLDGIIRIDRYTTQLPCLLSDVAIIEGELGKSNEEQAYHISPMMVAARGRWLWAQCIQKWHNKSPAPGDYPEFSQSIQNLRSSLSDRSDSEWVGVYLEMQIDRAYCMLGLSVWRLERFRQTGCQDKIIETARAFLLKYTQLHEALRTKEQEWFLAGIVQPLHALVILAIHLTNCAHLEEEKRSTYSLLKHVIAIRSKTMSSGNTVSGEPSTKSYLNPRHRALLYLLRRVCRKIGWSLLPKDNFANAPTPPSRDDDGLQGLQIPKHVETSLPEALLRTTDDYEVASVQVTVPMIEDALGCDYATALHWDDWDALSAQFFPV